MHEHWENAKKRKAQVNKIALRKCDVRSQFFFYFFFLPKLLGYFGKLMKMNRKRSEISITYCIGIIIMYPLELLIMKRSIEVASFSLTLMNSF